MIAVYDRRSDEVIAAVAGDIFLDRIYWASKSGYPEGLDFITHSWFRLEGGPTPKASLQGARINVLTTKVSRYRALADQTALMNALHAAARASTGHIRRLFPSGLLDDPALRRHLPATSELVRAWHRGGRPPENPGLS